MSAPTPRGPFVEVTGWTADVLAKVFHEAYERLAPYFGYQTNKGTRVFDANSPNGKLMIAVCDEIITMLRTDPLPDLERGQTYSTLEQVPLSIESHLRKEIAQYRTLLEEILYHWQTSDIFRLRARRLLGYDNPSKP